MISNALFKLSIAKKVSLKNEKFDVFFTASLMKMIPQFRNKLMKKYIADLVWKKINKLIDTRVRDDIFLSLVKNDRKNNHNMSFMSQRLCISTLFVKNILQIAHDSNYSDFDKIYHNVCFVLLYQKSIYSC